MDELIAIYKDLLKSINTQFVRYLYDVIDWDARLIAIVGSRGVGKTTLVLQHIKLKGIKDESLYVSADNIYFAGNTLFDLAGSFYKYGGKYLFIDEIHKYQNWSQEIKNIYDSYPGLNITFTGSSILDIYKGFGDLSRRSLSYYLPGLSFREFLLFEKSMNIKPVSLEEVVNAHHDFAIEKPLPLFKEYLQYGYYPFYKEGQFIIRLHHLINAVMEVDIPKYLGLKAASIDRLKLLLQIVSESAPFKPNMSKIAEMTGVSRNVLPDYFSFLERAELIIQARSSTKGIRGLGKLNKVYLNNTNLMHALSPSNKNIGNVRETFFANQIRINHDYSIPESGDFLVDNHFLFEVGGKNKSQKQIAGKKNAFVVKDDIEYGFGNTLPLWYFGMLY